MASTIITLKHLYSFHTLDRKIFFRLVLILHHDPGVSLLVMAIYFSVGLARRISKGAPYFPIHVPRFPYQTFGIITVVPRILNYIIPNKNGPLENIWSLKPKAQVDDRTILLTFSRGGHHMTEEEVVELFNSKYRDCVEDVHMVPPTSSKHFLYIQTMVRYVSTIDQILSTSPIAMFKINGRDVSARKYESRDQHIIKRHIAI
ncbi:hypothetical protein RDI58_020033 [Solanum bulbocastanum]|uniref:Uncharacterized protein n=1 Tax=Solanum bulbocastanum TaxID=147425 RepID=A0AAN8TBS8_SOLBU